MEIKRHHIQSYSVYTQIPAERERERANDRELDILCARLVMSLGVPSDFVSNLAEFSHLAKCTMRNTNILHTYFVGTIKFYA